jgi:hypothetical protein
MTSIGDLGKSHGDIMRRLAELEREVKQLRTGRRLEAASIGRGGLVLRGGKLQIIGGEIIAGDPEGFHARTTSTGYQLVNEDGEVDMDLTISGPNQIRLRGDGGEEENEILLTSTGEINSRVLNVDEIILDGQNLSDILEVISEEVTGNPNPDPEAPPPAGTITTRYTASWSQSYRGNRNPNEFTSSLHQGWYSSTNGNQRALIGFPSSQIQSDHSGRTITRVRVYLYFHHWFFNSGGTAILGHHGHSSPPSTFSATSTDVTRSSSWPKPGGRWVTYSHSMQQWATGTKRGIVLGPGPTTSRLYYGSARRHNHSSRPPRIEIRSTA